jgi:hypothetical protein
MNAIYNEQTKLAANNLDRLSTAFVAVGVLGKSFDITPASGLIASILNVTIWLCFAGALHIAARYVLRRLKP